MKPPLAQRYVIGNWIAVTVAVLGVVIGTSLLWSVSDQLPERIVLHWNDGQPDITATLATVLTLAAVLTLGLPALVLLAGRRLAGSWRHTWSSGALFAAVAPAVMIYGTAWAQRHGPVEYPPPSSMIIGVGWSFIPASILKSWLRPPTARSVEAPLVPPVVRQAWVGRAATSWTARCSSIVGAALYAVFLAWLIDDWILLLLMGSVVVVTMVYVTRSRDVVVDYSGVGIRDSGSRPSPIRMAEIVGASVGDVSALKDFGGWGYRLSVTGVEGWIARSGEALVVHRWDKPDFVFTVDDADEAASVLNSLVSKLRAQTFVDLPHPYGDRTPSPAD